MEKLLSITPKRPWKHQKKQLRPPPKRKKKAKRLEVEAAAIARGTEIGKTQAHKKKSLVDSAKEHIGRMIDNTSLLDVAAVAAGTVLIHGLILASPDLKQKVIKLIPIGVLGAAGIPYSMAMEAIQDLGLFQATEGPEVQRRESLRGPLAYTPSSQGIPAPLKDDWPYWIAAFFIAFILVRNGAQLLGLLDRGIGQIVGMMLA
jgi:hypothetical protein